MPRVIPIMFRARDAEFVDAIKRQHGVDIAETVRLALNQFRRQKRSFDDGYVDMLMHARTDEPVYVVTKSGKQIPCRAFCDLDEFFPTEMTKS